MTRVAAEFAFSGATGESASERQLIKINFNEDMIKAMTSDTQSYIFLTYNTSSRVSVGTDGNGFLYKPLTRKNITYTEDGTAKGYSAYLFRAGDGAGANVSLLQLRLTLEQQAQVQWRAVLVVVQGLHSSATVIDWKDAAEGSKVKVQVPQIEGAAVVGSLLFLGHPANEVATGDPPAWNPFLTNCVPPPPADPEHCINAFWTTTSREDVWGGPWFVTVVSTYTLLPEEDVVGERPPPVDADTFWAYPSLCEMGDVFVINNIDLANSWDDITNYVFDQDGPPAKESVLKDLDTLILNHTDADGTRWSMTDLQGWWTLPPPQLPDINKAGYFNGMYPADGRYQAREITVSGTFIPGPGVNIAVPRQRLLRALDSVRRGAMFVAKEPWWPKQAWVYLSGQPKLSTSAKINSRLTTFEFNLRAVDPIKYHAGDAGLLDVGLVESTSGYLGRTYQYVPPAVEGRTVLNWNSATTVGAVQSGQVLSTGNAFNSPRAQTVAVSKTAPDGTAVDLGMLQVGDPLNLTVGETRTPALYGTITSLNHQDAAWVFGVTVDSGSSASKPNAGDPVSVEWRTGMAERYSEEQYLRGARFRPVSEPPPLYDPVFERGVPTLAPNPWRRYQELVAPTVTSVVNAGTAVVRPRVYVYGPCVSPVVTNLTTGQQMKFLGAIAAGEVLVAECLWHLVVTRSANILPSRDQRGDLEGYGARWRLSLDSEWLTLVPGENKIMLSGAAGLSSGGVRVVYRSGWMG